MDSDTEKPGAGPGAGAATGTGTGKREHGYGRGRRLPLFDHKKLEVYQVAREFLVRAAGLLARKMPRYLRDLPIPPGRTHVGLRLRIQPAPATRVQW